jgi:hypothetical protein
MSILDLDAGGDGAQHWPPTCTEPRATPMRAAEDAGPSEVGDLPAEGEWQDAGRCK